LTNYVTVNIRNAWRRLSLVKGIVNSAQSHSGANAASNHSHPALFVVDLLLNYAQDFVVNWIVRLWRMHGG